MDASDSIHEHRMLKQTRSALHRIRKGLEIEQHQTNNTPAAASPGGQAARLPTPGLPYPYKMDRQLQEKRRKQCNFPLPLPLPTSHFLLPTSHFPLPTSHFPLPTSTSHFPLPTSHFPLPTSHFPLPTSTSTSHFPLPTSTSHFPLPLPEKPHRLCPVSNGFCLFYCCNIQIDEYHPAAQNKRQMSTICRSHKSDNCLFIDAGQGRTTTTASPE